MTTQRKADEGGPMTPEEHRMLRFGNIYVPILTVASVLGAVIYLTWQLSVERTRVYGEINSVRAEVQSLTDNVSRFVRSVEERIAKGTTDRYSRTDRIIDCLRHQILNPNWRCVYSAPNAWKTSITSLE